MSVSTHSVLCLPWWLCWQERTSALIKQLSSKGLPSPFTIEQAPPNYEGTASVASMISALDEDDDEEGGGSDQDVEDEYVIIR